MDINLLTLDEKLIYMFKNYNKKRKSYLSQIKSIQKQQTRKYLEGKEVGKAIKNTCGSLHIIEYIRHINTILQLPFYISAIILLSMYYFGDDNSSQLLQVIFILLGIMLCLSLWGLCANKDIEINYLNKITLIKVIDKGKITEELYELCLSKVNNPKKTLMQNVTTDIGLNTIIFIVTSVGLAFISDNLGKDYNTMIIILLIFYCIIFIARVKSTVKNYHIFNVDSSHEIMQLIIEIYESEIVKTSFDNTLFMDKKITRLEEFSRNIVHKLK